MTIFRALGNHWNIKSYYFQLGASVKWNETRENGKGVGKTRRKTKAVAHLEKSRETLTANTRHKLIIISVVSAPCNCNCCYGWLIIVGLVDAVSVAVFGVSVVGVLNN